MPTPALDSPIPDTALTLVPDEPEVTKLSDLQGQWVVLFFYPRDDTPGCTAEAIEFTELQEQFTAAGARLVGASRDNARSHGRFTEKHSLGMSLVADTEEALCAHFDVMKDKMMYGKQVRGIERSTFLIGPDGVLRFEWRKLKAKGHAAIVLEQLQALQA